MIIIDGYNLLYQSDFEKREDLIWAVDNYLRRSHKSGLIIFDGFSPEDLSTPLLEVRFAGNADDEIKFEIDACQNPNSYSLVTDDKDILYYARQKNIQTIKCHNFSALINDSQNVKIDPMEKPDEDDLDLSAYNYFRK